MGIDRPAGASTETLCFDADRAALGQVSALWLSASLTLSAAETEALLAALPGLRWVYSQRTGTDHLPLDCYRQRGIEVHTTGDLVSGWVAQMNLACILSHAKRIPLHIDLQRRHRAAPIYCDDPTDQTAVIIGTGNIGAATARLCQAIGLKVIGLSRRPEAAPADFDAVLDLATGLGRGLAAADYLVLALPLTDATRALIDRDGLQQMKQGACIINLARPPLVDERALLDALRNGAVAAAYVSGLQEVSRWRRRRAERQPNLVITHYSDAHLRKKNQLAFAQFLDLLARWQAVEPGRGAADPGACGRHQPPAPTASAARRGGAGDRQGLRCH